MAKRIVRKAVIYMILTAGAIIMVFPFYWMIVSSLKTAPEMNLFPPDIIPHDWTNFNNYVKAFNTAPFGRYLLNSVIVCVVNSGIVIFTTILAAFAFSHFCFPGRKLLFTLLLSMMMVPFELLIITNYRTIVKTGLYDTLYALIIPFTSSIFYTYILHSFFQSVPEDLYSAARMDGAGNWYYLWKVMVPMARPCIVTILLLNAMGSWNNFMWPKLVIARDELRTLPYGLFTFTTESGSNTEVIMAAATIGVLPMLLLFFFVRKQIVTAVASGGIKE